MSKFIEVHHDDGPVYLAAEHISAVTPESARTRKLTKTTWNTKIICAGETYFVQESIEDIMRLLGGPTLGATKP